MARENHCDLYESAVPTPTEQPVKIYGISPNLGGSEGVKYKRASAVVGDWIFYKDVTLNDKNFNAGYKIVKEGDTNVDISGYNGSAFGFDRTIPNLTLFKHIKFAGMSPDPHVSTP